jgi:hypothetical protein
MQERRSTTLAPEDWRRLDDLAAATQSVATSGPAESRGQPTWRALLRRIVRNEKILSFIEETLTEI